MGQVTTIIIGSETNLGSALMQRVDGQVGISSTLHAVDGATVNGESFASRVERLVADHPEALVVVALSPDDAKASAVSYLVDGPRWVQLSDAQLDQPEPRPRGEIARSTEGEVLSRGGLVLRATTIFGGGNDETITRVMRQIRVWRFPVAVGSPSRRLQPFHIDDLAGLLQSLARGERHSGRFSIGGERSVYVGALLAEISDVLGIRTAPVTLTAAAATLSSRWAQLFAREDPGELWSIAGDELVDDHEARVTLGWAPESLSSRLEQAAIEAGVLRPEPAA